MVNSRILLSGTIIFAAAALIIGGTFAFFSDTESSVNNTLTAGALDLKIDNTSYYNGISNPGTSWLIDDLTDQLFFDFTDVKPGDLGEDTISFHAENDYWLCAQTTLTENNDNTCTTPELSDDASCTEPNADLFDGELAQNINFMFWADDGDNVLEEGEKVFKTGTAESVLNDDLFTLADSTVNNLGGADGTPATGGATLYVGKAWCFGDLTEDRLPQDGVNDLFTPANSTGGVSCDGSSLNNETQTDRVLADIKFTATQARNNPGFSCTPPVIASCTENDIQYASGFSDNNQALRKNGTAILADRTVPASMFGIPQTSGAASDVGFPAGSFFSLGFTGGNIVLSYDEPFYKNPDGADVQVFEVTGGVYPDESVKVEVSLNGTDWFTATPDPGTRDAGFEMPIPSAQFIRLTEASNITPFEATADGYDVDAVKTFCRAESNL